MRRGTAAYVRRGAAGLQQFPAGADVGSAFPVPVEIRTGEDAVLPTPLGGFIGKPSIGGIVEVAVNAGVDVLDHLVERGCDRFAVCRATEITFPAFGMIQTAALRQ